MKNLYTILKATIFTPLLFAVLPGHSQNLVVNPSAEDGPPSTTGWTALSTGTSCSGGSGWRMPAGVNGYPSGVSSSAYIFNPGCGGAGSGASYELQQDINVSSNVTAIDAHAYRVSFSGYTQSFNQSPADEAIITVEYRNAANTTVLGSYTTGTTTNTSSVWVRYSDVRLAPVGTRFIRVRLLGVSRNGNAIDAYFDDISVVGLSVLPVDMVSFTASAQNDKVNLRWKTANEVNSKGFTVQRSAEGLRWMDIGFVKAGTQAANDYFFSDGSPLSGTGFYRLQQTGLDGGSTLSKVVTVNVAVMATVGLYPNPTKDKLFFTSSQPVLSVEIADNLGRLLERHTGVNFVSVAHLRPGTYVAKLNGRDFTEYKQFVKE